MLVRRRRTPGVLLGFALSTLVVACADFTTGPKGVVRGPRSLKDSTETQWADTLECRYGWQVINTLVVCDPPV
jgi:hypothetical protein